MWFYCNYSGCWHCWQRAHQSREFNIKQRKTCFFFSSPANPSLTPWILLSRVECSVRLTPSDKDFRFSLQGTTAIITIILFLLFFIIIITVLLWVLEHHFQPYSIIPTVILLTFGCNHVNNNKVNLFDKTSLKKQDVELCISYFFYFY